MSTRLAPEAARAADRRGALELPAAENAELCRGCTRCCETVSVEVDSPSTPREYDQWIWVLHHRDLALYIERPDKWFLHIETRCEQLNEAGRCRIHGRHPILCREYDPRVCERRLPLTDQVAWFGDAPALEAWLRERRPGQWKRLVAWREARARTPSRKDGQQPVDALLQIGEPAHAGHEPATRLPERVTRRTRRARR